MKNAFTAELLSIYDLNAIRQIAEGAFAHKRILEREENRDGEAIEALRELGVACTEFIELVRSR